MENLLIVLVFVGSIIYKIYSSYKEEMEKSAKRNIQRPSLPPDAENTSMRKPHRPSVSLPPIPQTLTREVPKEIVTKSNVIQDIPDEVQRVKRNRKIQEKYNQEKTVADTAERPALSFDLRQAVIQAAILDRPYKE